MQYTLLCGERKLAHLQGLVGKYLAKEGSQFAKFANIFPHCIIMLHGIMIHCNIIPFIRHSVSYCSIKYCNTCIRIMIIDIVILFCMRINCNCNFACI